MGINQRLMKSKQRVVWTNKSGWSKERKLESQNDLSPEHQNWGRPDLGGLNPGQVPHDWRGHT